MYYQNVYKNDEMKRGEHNAVRNTVGWYYFTHQLLEVTGKDTAEFLDKVCACPIANLAVGRDRYTTLLYENGQILDDVIVLRLAEDKFWVSTLFIKKLIDWFDMHKGEAKITYTDVTEQYDMYAVQGPKSKELISILVKNNIENLKFFAIEDNEISGIPVKINRGGFTGEKFGYEIYVAPDQRDVIEQKLEEEAAKLGGRQVTEFQIMAITLPTEKGFYHMRDLLRTNPLEVGLERGIKYDREFIGKEALLKIKEEGPAREMLGFTVDKDDVNITHKGFGGPGEAVMLNGEEIGRVSKFTYSFVLDKNIGYALVTKDVVKAGDHVVIHGEDAVITDKVFIK